MSKEVQIKNIRVIINTEVIERDIVQLEAEGKIGRIENNIFKAPRPNVHGLLACMRDNRQYDSQQIESVCMRVCPFYSADDKLADDMAHLDDCRVILFEGTSLDGKTPYMIKINGNKE